MATGAVVAGRGTFEPAGGWGGDHHDGVPIWVLSRREPGIDVSEWPLVTYVDDVDDRDVRGQAAAGDKNVLVHGAATAQLALAAGILDELEIHLIPVLLGQGRRLFDNLAPSTSSWSARGSSRARTASPTCTTASGAEREGSAQSGPGIRTPIHGSRGRCLAIRRARKACRQDSEKAQAEDSSAAVASRPALAPGWVSGRSTTNVAPAPGVLSTATDPPSSSARRRTRGRPSPVPRISECGVPTCTHSSKTRARSSALRPGPVSATAKRTVVGPDGAAVTRTKPASVTFSALTTRLRTIWVSLRGSVCSGAEAVGRREGQLDARVAGQATQHAAEVGEQRREVDGLEADALAAGLQAGEVELVVDELERLDDRCRR